jgi:hypothetical protein
MSSHKENQIQFMPSRHSVKKIDGRRAGPGGTKTRLGRRILLPDSARGLFWMGLIDSGLGERVGRQAGGK